MDIDEIISYLKSQHSTNNKDQIIFIKNFPSIQEVFSFEGILEELKIISEYMKDGENMNLRNKDLLGGWMSVARMVYKRDKLIERKSLPPELDLYDYISI